jgi:septal ring factor EnvC (AmiA/AmiB activator)
MAARCVLIFLAGVAACQASLQGSGYKAAANPVRKVVTLLQKMQKAVEAEGEKEKELYDKFVCYCKTGSGDLSASISAAETKIPALGSQIESAEAEKKETEETLAQARTDRADAKAAMAAATGQRDKEAAAFAKFQADSVANIGAIVKAVAVLEKGVSGSFLQTGTADALRKIFSDVNRDMPEYDRQQVLSFLSGNPFSQGYSSQSGSIIGILKQMGDEMATALAGATHEEEKAIHIYNQLMAAKTSEVNALTMTIERKIQKSGELAVSIAQMKNDQGDTAEALAEDKKFLAELETSCDTKAKEWEERSKTRADELLALAETIKILNNDDALELFKKTLPGASASLLEVSEKAESVRSRAGQILLQAARRLDRPHSTMLGFVELALRGKKIGFEKVIAMIDEMVATLKKEQVDDDSKQDYCTSELDTSDDKKKSLEKSISDTEAAIATAKETIATLAEEIAAVTASIETLDNAVAEATELRKSENADYKELMASDTAAKEVLEMALNRLNKYYNPKMYKAPAKVERSTMDAIYQDVGGFVQIRSHAQQEVAPAPPPATWDAYSKKTEEHGGVVQMMKLLIADLDKEMTEAETAEKDAQADYETLMKESASKRAEDSKSLADKQGAKAATEGDLQSHGEDLKEGQRDLASTLKYIHDLHMECDWLLKYFDVRKEMRASEVDALGKAKAVLNGADFSLLQTSRGLRGASQ